MQIPQFLMVSHVRFIYTSRTVGFVQHTGGKTADVDNDTVHRNGTLESTAFVHADTFVLGQ